MWNHTSVLLLGGYSISAVFSRCELELRLASWLQRKLGARPKCVPVHPSCCFSILTTMSRLSVIILSVHIHPFYLRYFILAVMILGLFLSTWISNSTAPILISSFITPIVKDLPSDSRFSRALLLGLVCINLSLTKYQTVTHYAFTCHSLTKRPSPATLVE